MTDRQREHLDILAQEAGEEAPDNLSRAEADRKIDEYQRRAGMKPF